MMTGFEQYTRKTRRAIFLEEMEQVVPWREFASSRKLVSATNTILHDAESPVSVDSSGCTDALSPGTSLEKPSGCMLHPASDIRWATTPSFDLQVPTSSRPDRRAMGEP